MRSMFYTHPQMLLLILFLLSVLGCSNGQQAGVMTDTHTGGKVSGRILDQDGNPASARIRLVSSDFSALADQPQIDLSVGSDGLFELDSIPEGEWLLLITNVRSNSTAIYELKQSSDSSEEIDLGDLSAYPAATIYVHLEDYDLQLHDTLYIGGTESATIITTDMLMTGFVTLSDVPNQFDLHLKVSRADTTFEIDNLPPVNSEQKILLTSDTTLSASYHLRLNIPIEAPDDQQSLNDLPFPVWLPTSIQSPCLADAGDQLIPLDSTLSRADSILYWGTFAELPPALEMENSATQTSIEFKIIENCPLSTTEPGRLTLHMDQQSDSISVWGNSLWLDSNSSSFMIESFNTFTESGNVGLGFWLRMDAAEQSSTYTQIFDTRSDNSGFRIQQKANRTTAELRIDTKDGAYNALFGPSEILDGNWHHYALSIHQNKLIVVVDGVTIADTTFNLGSGFTDSFNPLIGGDPNMRGHVDEFMAFDGSQNASWWELFYQLQNPETEWILE